MSATSATPIVETLQTLLDKGDLNTLADVIREIALGSMLMPVDADISSITSATAIDITNGAAAAAGNLGGGTVALEQAPSAGYYPGTVPITGGTGHTLPPIASVISLRDAHSNIVVDKDGTAVASTATYPGTVLLSDDGKTLTFASALTGFSIKYIPLPFALMSSAFAGEA